MAKAEKQPKYQLIKDYVTSRITTGEYAANDRIPSESEFSSLLGVSSITVRKALSELVNEGLILRIKGKGSFVADNKKRQGGTSGLFAFLLTTVNIHDASIMKFIMGAQEKLAESGCSLIVENLVNHKNNERSVIDRLMESGADGFIVYPDLPNNADYLGYLEGLNVPYVLLDRRPKDRPASFVGCNNHDGGLLATRHLIDFGHRKIGFVAYYYNVSSEFERFQGYQSAMHAAGLSIDEDLFFLTGDTPWEKIVELTHSGRLTSVFCVNDRKAMQLVDKLTALGVRIPEELSVVGFDDAQFTEHPRIQLTTIRQPFQRIGYSAASMLLDLCRDPHQRLNQLLLGPHLIIRASTQRLAEDGREAK